MYLNSDRRIPFVPPCKVEYQQELYLNCKVVNPPLKYELVEYQQELYLNPTDRETSSKSLLVEYQQELYLNIDDYSTKLRKSSLNINKSCI